MRTMLSGRTARCPGLTLCTALAIAVAGCGREDIKVYQVPKEQADRARGPLPAGHPETSSMSVRPGLAWTTPEGWKETRTGEIRVASFSIQGEEGRQAEVSVVPLGGMAGGDLANVNRWRVQQLGLKAVTAEELKRAAEPVEVAGETADLYDLAGKNPGSDEPLRILGVIQHRDGTAWFYKMTGDDELVAQQKPAFIEFLKSVKFVAGTARARSPAPEDFESLPPGHPPLDDGGLPPGHPPLNTGGLPPGHPELSTTAGAAQATVSREGQPNWTIPSGWKEIPGGEFLVAKFMLSGEGGAQAEVNVSRSAGDGGGFAPNVNRWRGQLGLKELSSAALEESARKIETAAGPGLLIEMSGTDARSSRPAAVAGAMVTHSGQTWFYKLMGNPQLVESQKETFTKFVQSVKY